MALSFLKLGQPQENQNELVILSGLNYAKIRPQFHRLPWQVPTDTMGIDGCEAYTLFYHDLLTKSHIEMPS